MNIDDMSKYIAKQLYTNPFEDRCPCCSEMPETEMINSGSGIRPERYNKTQFEIIKECLTMIRNGR
jgi:hypothetical protein